MRKFTLFLAAFFCCAFAAQTVDYTVKFAVNDTAIPGIIYVVYNTNEMNA